MSCSCIGSKEIDLVKSEYVANRSVFIAGNQMVNILRSLGATRIDLERLKSVSDNLSKDPTLAFRESRNGRFTFDLEKGKIQRTKFQPFVLSAEEDFVRYDSGKIRYFRGIQDELQLNTAFQALLRFKAAVIEGIKIRKRANLNYESKKWLSTVFNLRTITTPDILGEPALEGVHSDGVDHTMTTFLGWENTTSDSAVTYLHDMEEKNGLKYNEANPSLVLSKYQHRSFLDTVMIVDHESKHSLSAVHASNNEKVATRDMLIFFTRKPVTEEHFTYPYDSLELHEEIPMELDLN